MPAAIGQVQVVGSSTGPHSGTIEPDSDNDGASFVPSTPFRRGETVTVTTSMNVIGAKNGTFTFAIARTAGAIVGAPIPLAQAGANGLQHFHSRPDLLPPAVTVASNQTPDSQGDIFLAPQAGPAQNGPMILDPHGRLIWFQPFPVAGNRLITDFRVQTYQGQPVLTWWQGTTNHGSGEGEGIIFNQSYQQIAVVQAGNGLSMDLHEFLVTPQGQAWINAVSPVYIPGISRAVIDDVIQEIDVPTGLVMFEWHTLDHVPIGDSYFGPTTPGYVYDPYHLNSLWPLSGGAMLASLRNTSALYKIDEPTGRVLWTFGGKRSSFRLGTGTSTAFQHDAITQGDGSITVFDDGAGPPALHPFSRGIRVRLDTQHFTATLEREYDHSPDISSNFEGGVQDLSGGDVFMGWGQQPFFSEDDALGHQILDGRFTVPTTSYRAYRFPWSAQPPTTPALALAPASDGTTYAYASWNGATDVSFWQVLAGPSTSTLSSQGTIRATSFETAIPVHTAAPYFQVSALGPSGSVLASSSVQSVPSHLALFGHGVFVSSSGTGAVPAGCLSPNPCSVSTTVSAGRTVVARTGRESIPAGSGSLLFFTLTAAGRSMLTHARGARVPVAITAHDASGMTATVVEPLIPFSTQGSGPSRSVTQAPTVTIVGLTDFVSSGGIGGLLVGCPATTPCLVKARLAVGNTTISSTGQEFIGAGELGYVYFSLSSAGRAMLAHASGNQLGVTAAVTSGAASATGKIALIGFK
jgi:hypothetical protein